MVEETAEGKLRQQLTAFAQFTSRSLGETDIPALMLDACLRGRAGLGMSHAKLLEYLPSADRMLMRAGVGWKPGYVGHYQVPPDIDTPIGYCYVLSEPVLIANYREEKRYRFPSILKEHGCISSINVPVRTDAGSFGVLEVDDTQPRRFSDDDLYFLKGLGNTVARAVELNRAVARVRAALDEKQLMIREMNHRIKNNLSLVAAILALQARRSSEAPVREELNSAVARINNLALVHDRLQLFTSSVTKVDAEAHFQELCAMLSSMLSPGISLTTCCTGWITSDYVEALTLIANELITNAAKHAFVGRRHGQIVLRYREEGAGWRLSVEDNGAGAPTCADTRGANSFGRQLIETLAMRLNAQITRTYMAGTRVEVYSGLSSQR
jgi:two-component sensor histidine kinase